jgi:hypothetical protein
MTALWGLGDDRSRATWEEQSVCGCGVGAHQREGLSDADVSAFGEDAFGLSTGRGC